jgi:hypothetical protein
MSILRTPVRWRQRASTTTEYWALESRGMKAFAGSYFVHRTVYLEVGTKVPYLLPKYLSFRLLKYPHLRGRPNLKASIAGNSPTPRDLAPR